MKRHRITGDDAIAYRVRLLPQQLERARRRHQQLIDEAARLSMTDLLKPGETPNGKDR